MARPKRITVPKELDTPLQPFPSDVTIKWPNSPSELAPIPRLFRVHRLDAYTWQAYCVLDGQEFRIGKPDVIDLIVKKIALVMRQEGQMEFMEKKREQSANSN